MASTPEGKVKAKVKKILDEFGVYHFSPYMGGFGRAGVPDIIGCGNGIFIGIECKTKGKKPTALQQRELEKIFNCGGFTFVVDESNVDSLKWNLEILLSRAMEPKREPK